jgi:hypothetical protein
MFRARLTSRGQMYKLSDCRYENFIGIEREMLESFVGQLTGS